ncbi:MAG: hypothetical protein A3G41_03885 [Elusimicrobia bacterium RIFCSPLOWO2_12_FULL_59_9]|nr:MAG: hypothetical protein A3G41_03885 [Elusimicrobia bacterium RIFCSPLOWO2_12_FULL_59_9]
MTGVRPLSHSSMSMYAECPQKYKLKYVDGHREKPKYFFSFGNSLHKSLEYFYGAQMLVPPGLEDVLKYYQDHWLGAGYKDARQETEYFAEGRKILTGFYHKHIGEFKRPFYVEYNFDLKIEGVAVTGKVDRIDQLDDGSLAVIDYKTGKPIPQERVQVDPQLTLYQLACEETLGKPVKSLTFYNLQNLTPLTVEPRSGAQVAELKERVVVDPQLTLYQLACEETLGKPVKSLTFYNLQNLTPLTVEPRSGAQVAELKERVVAVAGFIAGGRFEPIAGKQERPGWEKICRWCDFKSFCPAYTHLFPEGSADAAPGPRPRAGGTGRMEPQGGVSSETGPAASAQKLSALADRYGQLKDELLQMEKEAESLGGEIAALMSELGLERALGQDYEVSRESQTLWNFKDRERVREILKSAWLYDKVLVESRAALAKLLGGHGIPPNVRERLQALGEKVEQIKLSHRRIQPEASAAQDSPEPGGT